MTRAEVVLKRLAGYWPAIMSSSLLVGVILTGIVGGSSESLICASGEPPAVCLRNWIGAVGGMLAFLAAAIGLSFAYGQVLAAREQAGASTRQLAAAVIPLYERRLQALKDIQGFCDISVHMKIIATYHRIIQEHQNLNPEHVGRVRRLVDIYLEKSKAGRQSAEKYLAAQFLSSSESAALQDVLGALQSRYASVIVAAEEFEWHEESVSKDIDLSTVRRMLLTSLGGHLNALTEFQNATAGKFSEISLMYNQLQQEQDVMLASLSEGRRVT